MVFVTFFGCCFSLALLAAALGTRYWFVSSCRQRINPITGSTSQVPRKRVTAGANTTEVVHGVEEDDDSAYRPNSTGFINFGLFLGDKGLNVGFGERISQFEGVYYSILKINVICNERWRKTKTVEVNGINLI